MSDKKELTIEEKAREYADSLSPFEKQGKAMEGKYYYERHLREGYIAGYKSHQKETAKQIANYHARNLELQLELDIAKQDLTSLRWRSVEEEMPPSNIDILGRDKDGDCLVCFYGRRSKKFLLDIDNEVDVTHWMPIPKREE